MNDTSLNDRLFLSFALALGCIVAGAGNALFGPRTWWTRSGVASVGLATTLFALSMFNPEFTPNACLIGAGCLVLVSCLHLNSVRSIAARLWSAFQRPRLAWATLALGGFALMGFELTTYDRAQEYEMRAQEESMAAMAGPKPYSADSKCLAATDRGTPIKLMSPEEIATCDSLSLSEQQTLVNGHFSEYVIRRGKADDSSNCHGWVFAAGKYAILGADVETILIDNQYEPVSAPRPGDLCLYRNEEQGVAHTAVIRSVLDDGTVLVESKWGRLGVFLHPVERSAYGTNFTFQHSPRGAHTLHSIP